MPGDSELERLYDEHAQALFAFLLSLTRDEEDTRDVLQDVFAKLAREPQLVSEVRNERAFLIRLAHNAAIDVMRRRAARNRGQKLLSEEPLSLFAASPNPDELVFRAELSTALGGLPAEQRAVVHLKLWEGLTFEEIGSALGIPPNTAASRFRYGLDKLRGLLRPFYEEIR
jgi:RNA polymerase sigma-70 factor (ECF subfamily)